MWRDFMWISSIAEHWKNYLDNVAKSSKKWRPRIKLKLTFQSKPFRKPVGVSWWEENIRRGIFQTPTSFYELQMRRDVGVKHKNKKKQPDVELKRQIKNNKHTSGLAQPAWSSYLLQRLLALPSGSWMSKIKINGAEAAGGETLWLRDAVLKSERFV